MPPIDNSNFNKSSNNICFSNQPSKPKVDAKDDHLWSTWYNLCSTWYSVKTDVMKCVRFAQPIVTNIRFIPRRSNEEVIRDFYSIEDVRWFFNEYALSLEKKGYQVQDLLDELMIGTLTTPLLEMVDEAKTKNRDRLQQQPQQPTVFQATIEEQQSFTVSFPSIKTMPHKATPTWHYPPESVIKSTRAA